MLLLVCLTSVSVQARTDNPFYARSYGIVIGIDKYPSSKWQDLRYAKKDAKGFAQFLLTQGFQVIELYDWMATEDRIESEILKVARKLRPSERVIVFYSGHGHTETLAGEDFGYIVPYDGTDDSATYISMEELRTLSRKLGTAKHQLFILDACFGGLIADKASTAYERAPWPDYLKFVTENEARQFITAGGKGQIVKDGGPNGYSYFTGFLLEGLTEGKADLYPDGYITFAELAAYLIPRATNEYQVPVTGVLPQHGQGQFVFRSPRGSWIEYRLPDERVIRGAERGFKSAEIDALKDWAERGFKSAEIDAFKDCDFCPEMVRIQGGCFQMGSPMTEKNRDDDERQHRVCVKDFAIGKYEVTFAEYERFAEATGQWVYAHDEGWGQGRRPVINENWQNAMDYASWLSRETGKRYRLPTEAEWEYAARAGTITAYWWGNEIGQNRANCAGCGSRWDGKQTAPVGSFDPNPFGLYDTVGNVYEWTCSKYTVNYDGSEQKCASRGDSLRSLRSHRGGSWSNKPEHVRSAFRNWNGLGTTARNRGFRLARD